MTTPEPIARLSLEELANIEKFPRLPVYLYGREIKLLLAAARREAAMGEENATLENWRAILRRVRDGLHCPAKGSLAHYCPNCDQSLYDLKESLDALLPPVPSSGPTKEPA